jgi:glycosyltransferase involved in cell wall biosynthesis
LARGIGALLRFPLRMETMGQNARRRAEERFAMEAFAQQTLEVYGQAIKDSGCN